MLELDWQFDVRLAGVCHLPSAICHLPSPVSFTVSPLRFLLLSQLLIQTRPQKLQEPTPAVFPPSILSSRFFPFMLPQERELCRSSRLSEKPLPHFGHPFLFPHIPRYSAVRFPASWFPSAFSAISREIPLVAASPHCVFRGGCVLLFRVGPESIRGNR